MVISDVVITETRKQGKWHSSTVLSPARPSPAGAGDDRIRNYQEPAREDGRGVPQEPTGQYEAEKLGCRRRNIRKFDTMQDALLDVPNRRAMPPGRTNPRLAEMLRKGYPELETVGGIFVAEQVWRRCPTFGAGVAGGGEPGGVGVDKIIADGRYDGLISSGFGSRCQPTTRPEWEFKSEGPREALRPSKRSRRGEPTFNPLLSPPLFYFSFFFSLSFFLFLFIFLLLFLYLLFFFFFPPPLLSSFSPFFFFPFFPSRTGCGSRAAC